MPVYHRRRRHGFRFWSATVPVSCMIEPPTSPFMWSHLDDLAIAPFTLRRWLQDGRVRRVLRRVYVSSLLPDTLEMRARCSAFVLTTDALLCARPAAWIWGLVAHEHNERFTIAVLAGAGEQ